MKASEIQVGGVYEVNGVVAVCQEAKRGSYRFTPVGGGEPIMVTRASEVEPADEVEVERMLNALDAQPSDNELDAQFEAGLNAQLDRLAGQQAPTSEPASEPVSEPAYHARLSNQPHDSGLSNEGREAEAEYLAGELAHREWLASQQAPVSEPAVSEPAPPADYLDAEIEAERWRKLQAESWPTEAELNALEREWARLETALAEAPVVPEPVYADDELSVYESRWLAAVADCPPADSPLQGPCEVVEVERRVSDNCYPDDINFDGMGASDLPPRSTLGVERGQTRARAFRPRWARQLAASRLLAGVR